MAEQSFMRVEEVAAELGVSKSYAYKIVQKLNAELKAKGYPSSSLRIRRYEADRQGEIFGVLPACGRRILSNFKLRRTR